MFLVENDDRPTGKRKKIKAQREPWLKFVNGEWEAVYELYRNMKPAPPPDYLDSLELALVIKGKADDEDARAIFAHGKPLEFWGCPRLLVSKIVEAFSELQEEPECVDVTITALSRFGAARPSDATALAGFGAARPLEAWPQVYTTYLPCYACTTVEAVERRSIPRWRDPKRGWLADPVGTVDCVVEKFHISSKSIDKHLTVELYYQLEGMPETKREQSPALYKVTIRMANEACSARGALTAIATRSSATLLLVPDFALEVFGFLDRAHVGPSLLANRGLYDLLSQLKQRLSLHHLTCALVQEEWGPMCIPRFTGFYLLTVRHFQRELSYTDVRRFKMPSAAGARSDCALIRHYLSNAHVADLRTPWPYDAPFAIKMLASLAARNFSVGHVNLFAGANRLADYRSMDAVFGGLRMGSLYLSCQERRFVELVKTTDFLRMATVQRLRELKLTLTRSWDDRSKSPLWVSGIYLLRNCEYYCVDYEADRHLRSIERKIVRICEDFERGTITDTVAHFRLNSDSSTGMSYAFSRDNMLVSGMIADGDNGWDPINWDVYRFRNARTGEYLTACVGRKTSAYSTGSFLHIVKGEVYPGASFAKY
ncbi:hypothetical protein AAVH_19987 [Aphelenchoides avenae]|nr:hypothetical protein AAVH_19987 [Aphelenchus avenae]